MLTRYGRIITTTDDGKTWKPVAILKRALPQGIVSSTGYIKLVLNAEQEIAIVARGQTGGDYVGDFIVQEDGDWTNRAMSSTPILDALFLSDKDVLACGANLRPVNEKSHLKSAGVVLRSFDNGKSWQTIYRSKSYETFFFLTKVKDNDFYAVSDTGTFLRFTLPR